MRMWINLGVLIDSAAALAMAGAIQFAVHAGAERSLQLSLAAGLCAGVASFGMLRWAGSAPRRTRIRSHANFAIAVPDGDLPVLELANHIGPISAVSAEHGAEAPAEMQRRVQLHLERSAGPLEQDAANELRDALEELRRAIR